VTGYRVTYLWGTSRYAAELRPDGTWHSDFLGINAVLDQLARPADFRPADGDPFARACLEAARVLPGGRAEVPEQAPRPAGVVD
jgi:hypothetical protein